MPRWAATIHTRTWFPFLLLTLGVVLVFGQVVHFSFVNWDDPVYVYRNSVLLFPERHTFWERWFPRHFGYPIPLLLLSYRIDQWIFGVPTPYKLNLAMGWGFHVTNLLLWWGIVLLTCRLCWVISGSLWAGFAGAVLFAFHPVVAETVSWVTGRKELLVMLWSLLAILAIHRYLERPSWKQAAWVGVCALAALASKPNAIFLLPLGVWMWWTRKPPSLSRRDAVPLGVIGAVFGAACMGSVWVGMLWQKSLGAIQTSRSLGEILGRALWALGYHLKLLWVPIDLRAKYVDTPNGFDLYHALGILGLVGLVGLLLHPRTLRSTAGLGAAVWLLAYLPSSNLIPLSRFLADTYLFLPMIGVALMFSALFSRLVSLEQMTLRKPLYGALGVAAILLMVMTAQQVGIWRDSASLWEHTYRYHTNSPRVCRMLSFAYNETNQLQKAANAYEMCIKQFGPELYQNNLAITYVMLKQWGRAERAFRQILKRHPHEKRALYYLQLIQRRRNAPTTRALPRTRSPIH